MILGITTIAVSEPFVLAEKLGLSHEALFNVASTSSGQCWALTTYCPVPHLVPSSPANQDYRPGAPAAMMLKDLLLAREASRDVGARMPLGEPAVDIFAVFADAGYAEKDFSSCRGSTGPTCCVEEHSTSAIVPEKGADVWDAASGAPVAIQGGTKTLSTKAPYRSRMCLVDFGLNPQTRLVHQRHHSFAEELKIRREIEECDLDPVAAGALELSQFVNHVLRAADDLNIAAECAVRVSVGLPGNGVAAPLVLDEAFDRPSIGRVNDRLMVASSLAIGLATNDHRIDDSAKLAPAFGAGGFDPGIMRRQRGKRGVDLMAGWARNEDEVGMRRSVSDPGW